MKNIEWYINRIQAMSSREILWRIRQKCIQKIEKKTLYSKGVPVTEIPLNKKFLTMHPDVNRISMNWNNESNSLFNGMELFGVFDYKKYEKKWNAGFQTNNTWPETMFSYDIPCSQKEDIGDIRTNWELNRHFQFSALAKSYYISGEKKYYYKLRMLFVDWNEHNLFLHGVEWSSAMEIAIRVNSWIYTYCFLKKAFDKHGLKEDTNILDLISHGIMMMTDYITRHCSRFSSANNHLIVEMYAVALSGIFYDCTRWKKMALDLLNKELPVQNYSDGINREMSLHYQSFIMEAYGLLMIQMHHNKIKIPQLWIEYLSKMSEFLCDCCGEYGETIVFGDNDEGKILDLVGREFDYYRYVLDLMGMMLPQRYSDLDTLHENLYWIVPPQLIKVSRAKNCYNSPDVSSYEKGGYTLMRSKKHKVLIGIDHAELGFGPLAAHGHADALSFQMFIKGEPVFIDPGTYNYHVPKEARDEFRATRNHNTVCIDEKNQGKILGPFLWGKRYRRVDTLLSESKEKISLKAGIEYEGNLHMRTITIDSGNKFQISICDEIKLLHKAKKISQIFMLGANCIMTDGNIICGKYMVELDSNVEMGALEAFSSMAYNKVMSGTKLVYTIADIDAEKIIIKTLITIKEQETDATAKERKNAIRYNKKSI